MKRPLGSYAMRNPTGRPGYPEEFEVTLVAIEESPSDVISDGRVRRPSYAEWLRTASIRLDFEGEIQPACICAPANCFPPDPCSLGGRLNRRDPELLNKVRFFPQAPFHP